MKIVGIQIMCTYTCDLCPKSLSHSSLTPSGHASHYLYKKWFLLAVDQPYYTTLIVAIWAPSHVGFCFADRSLQISRQNGDWWYWWQDFKWPTAYPQCSLNWALHKTYQNRWCPRLRYDVYESLLVHQWMWWRFGNIGLLLPWVTMIAIPLWQRKLFGVWHKEGAVSREDGNAKVSQRIRRTETPMQLRSSHHAALTHEEVI